MDDSGADGAEIARSVTHPDRISPAVSFRDEDGPLFRLKESVLGKAVFSNEARGPAEELLALYWSRAIRGLRVIQQGERRYVGRERRRWRRVGRKLLAVLPLFSYESRFLDYDFRIGGELAFTVEHEAIAEPEEAQEDEGGSPRPGWTHDIGSAAMSDGVGLDIALDTFSGGGNFYGVPDFSCHLVRIHDPELDVRVVLGQIVLLARSPR
ncbi:hypothetical protein GCM10022247_02250 [Allokutzneria multivorans]|uniref:Uncharacterized protein n=1 Tax=Allokutzneria multivorans TaxID=1142134 RepID=A0ABP7QUV4_9PSEU